MVVTLLLLPATARDIHFGAPVQLGAERFQFPRNAHDIAPDLGGTPECVSLRIIYPEMEGRTPANRREMNMVTQDSRALQLLLCDPRHADRAAASRKSPDAVIENHLGMIVAGIPNLRMQDIINDLDTNEAFSLSELKLKDSVRLDPRYSHVFYKDRRNFAELDHEKAVTFLSCDSKDKYRNPGCEMYFAFRTILVKVTFRLPLLQEWKPIRDLLSAYLETHRAKSNE